jgi:hypothetical protein
MPSRSVDCDMSVHFQVDVNLGPHVFKQAANKTTCVLSALTLDHSADSRHHTHSDLHEGVSRHDTRVRGMS